MKIVLALGALQATLALPCVEAQSDLRLVVFDFRGLDANRVQRDVLDTLADRSDVDESQLLRVPTDRRIDSYQASELRDLLRPANVRAILMGELDWVSAQPRAARLRLVLWTDRGEHIELEVPVQQNGRLNRSGRNTIDQRMRSVLNRAFSDRQPDQTPPDVGPAPGQGTDPAGVSPGTAPESSDGPGSQDELEAIREEQARLALAVEQLQIEDETRTVAEVSGGFALLFRWATWDGDRTDTGGLAFPGQFFIKFRAAYGQLSINAEYHFVMTSPDNHGPYNTWLAFQIVDALDFKIGVLPVFFGIMPAASHLSPFSPLVDFGLEGQQELGAMLNLEHSNLVVNLAFYKSTERGPLTTPHRNTFDVVRADTDGDGVFDQDNEPLNQTNLWVTYTIPHDDFGSTQLGLSGRYGFLFNHTTKRNGHQWAAAAHLHGRYGPFDLQLEGGRYEFRPQNPAGISADSVLLGGRSVLQMTSGRGNFFVANVALNFELEELSIDLIEPYIDYAIIIKDVEGHDATQRISPGVTVASGNLFVLFAISIAKNGARLGGFPDAHLTGGASSWETAVFLVTSYLF